MTNYIYNDMNAYDIANKIIKAEEAYAETDYNSLPFYEKCSFVLHNNLFHHILSNRFDLTELKARLLPELEEKARTGEYNAPFYLATLSPSHSVNEYLSALEKAIDKGSAWARCYYADRILSRDGSKARDMLEETLAYHSLGEVNEDSQRNIYLCHCLLSRCGQTEDDRRHYARLSDEYALKQVLNGEYSPLIHLCIKRQSPEEKAFWKTVSFLVHNHFYKKHGVAISDELGILLVRGIGCEPMPEEAKAFYIERYSKKSFIRQKLIDILGIASEGESDMLEAEMRFEASARDGDPKGYRSLILLNVLKGDLASLSKICDRAISQYPDDLMAIFHDAYTDLLFANH